VKKPEEAMEILEAYDLTGTLRGAAALAGCDHKTVARLVAAREAAGGGLPEPARSRPVVGPFAEKIDELVDRSRAHVRADKAHAILVAMGYQGSYRTMRLPGHHQPIRRDQHQHQARSAPGHRAIRRFDGTPNQANLPDRRDAPELALLALTVMCPIRGRRRRRPP
jgi:hypothetical protein